MTTQRVEPIVRPGGLIAVNTSKDQCTRVQLHNRLECLLEEAHIKLSSLVSDLLGTSARRMLHAIADGEADPAMLAALSDREAA